MSSRVQLVRWHNLRHGASLLEQVQEAWASHGTPNFQRLQRLSSNGSNTCKKSWPKEKKRGAMCLRMFVGRIFPGCLLDCFRGVCSFCGSRFLAFVICVASLTFVSLVDSWFLWILASWRFVAFAPVVNSWRLVFLWLLRFLVFVLPFWVTVVTLVASWVLGFGGSRPTSAKS